MNLRTKKGLHPPIHEFENQKGSPPGPPISFSNYAPVKNFRTEMGSMDLHEFQNQIGQTRPSSICF